MASLEKQLKERVLTEDVITYLFMSIHTPMTEMEMMRKVCEFQDTHTEKWLKEHKPATPQGQGDVLDALLTDEEIIATVRTVMARHGITEDAAAESVTDMDADIKEVMIAVAQAQIAKAAQPHVQSPTVEQLRAIEWTGHYTPTGNRVTTLSVCPACRGYEYDQEHYSPTLKAGHKPDCWLNLALQPQASTAKASTAQRLDEAADELRRNVGLPKRQPQPPAQGEVCICYNDVYNAQCPAHGHIVARGIARSQGEAQALLTDEGKERLDRLYRWRDHKDVELSVDDFDFYADYIRTQTPIIEQRARAETIAVTRKQFKQYLIDHQREYALEKSWITPRVEAYVTDFAKRLAKPQAKGEQ